MAMFKSLPFILAVNIALLTGCSKKEKTAEEPTPANEPATADASEAPKPEAQAAAAPEQDALPGASDVRNALARKDYTGAVERLQILKGIAVNDQLWMAYRELTGEVGLVLAEAAKTDPKAQQALGTYRLMMYGR